MNCLDSTFLIDFLDATRPRHEAARRWMEAHEDGEEMNATDYPIAGTARNAGATLVTRDPDFERVRELDVEDYAEDGRSPDSSRRG